MFEDVESSYMHGSLITGGTLDENDGYLAAVSIDGYFPDNDQGEVIAEVILSEHGDIITAWHDNGARMDTSTLEHIKGAKETLRKIWEEEHEKNS